ncbi:hypothetical protein HOD83_00260 [Candidatus Woesearchaeota archaeon]|nr:hypothetical protein [Candidatus Woesearchaeota archaeon]MBT4114495.1 hypothetical protein [Candidatus Woesearchaeota archaeon]MBT4248010.1 hypothetical protein [Candidatus Woesearchaeota archaeon]
MRYDRLFGLFIVVVMLGSLAGVAVYNMDDTTQDPNGNDPIDDGSFEVNGFYFYEDLSLGGYVTLTVDELGNALSVPFRADPRNVSHITIEDTAVSQIVNAQKVYLTFDPNIENFEETKNDVQIAMGEVSRLISRVNVNQVVPTAAITADIPNETYDDTIPLKDCTHATDTVAVLYFTVGEGDTAKMQGNCTIISGNTGEDLILTADKYGMYLIGVKV